MLSLKLLGFLATLFLSQAVALAETTDIANVGSRSLNDTSLVCGVFATGDNWQAIDWADTLTYVVEPTTVFGSSVPANSCLRVEAYNTTGLYYCNENDQAWGINANIIGKAAQEIIQGCCGGNQHGAGEYGISGQKFLGNGTSVIIAYGNASLPNTTCPETFQYPGVNGKCVTPVSNVTSPPLIIRTKAAKTVCGTFATGDSRTIDGWTNLVLGTPGNFTVVTIPGSSCKRVWCYDTSAVYVCNDAVQDVGLTVDTIQSAAFLAAVACCQSSKGDTGAGQHAPVSAQIFLDWPFNVVVGYGNCNHPDNERPSIFKAPGVNGDCR